MNRKTVVFVFTAFLGLIMVEMAYCEDAHLDHLHDTGGVELGLSAGYVHLDDENEEAPGVHVHLSKRLGHDGVLEHLALGVGGEIIFADHEHYALMAPLSIYPWRGLVLAIAPGVEWAKHDGKTESEYAIHLEAAYVFELGAYDIGPVIDFSKTSDEEHYMIGIHFGIHL